MKNLLSAVVMLAVLTGAPRAAGATSVTSQDQRIAIDVTSKGFEPSTVHVEAGRPVVLVVTRRAEKTCAKEIVIKDQKIRQALPLNKAVVIRLIAKKPGTLRYACGMDMLAGTLVIE
jgi:plastocyanin domain-containing protein